MHRTGIRNLISLRKRKQIYMHVRLGIRVLYRIARMFGGGKFWRITSRPES